MLVGLKPVESLVGLPPMIKVGCASDFGGKSPFKVLKWESRGTCKLELTGKFKVSLVFNVGMPKPGCLDQEDPDRESLVGEIGEDTYIGVDVQWQVEWEGGEKIGEKVHTLLSLCSWQAASEWLYIVPWGLRKVLNYIARKYNNPPIYITENGMDDEEDNSLPLSEILDDKLRVHYFKGYLAAVAQAIKDGADVRGYFAWSLLDNFEWAQGYTKRFGLVYVDYKNSLTRHPKSSAYWFSRFLKGGEKKNGKEN
ncbi:hypothetical protein Goklo_028185 [Gossypium klotzschianum]|uniref:Beta-glucosidase n=1 Tax=Gossypium klotzschianum TaxID=34286 RepID=A0A7J8U0K5_9ROSI|nr:hypothetical protein [Gossypium klotzschianum]